MTNHLKKISKYKPSALQGSLQLEVARPRRSLAIEHPFERRAFSILSIALVALVAAYLYFVTATIFHVIAQNDATRQIDAINASIGALEQNYFALSQQVSVQEGQSLGLSSVKNTSYVYRPGSDAVADAQFKQI